MTGWRVPGRALDRGAALGDPRPRRGGRRARRRSAFHSFDGADTESLTLDQARRPDVIVAYEMLGAPVTREHGGPVRLYVAPMYGYKSLKWLDGIEVTDQVIPGYWEHERLRRRRMDREVQWPRRPAGRLTTRAPAAPLRPGRAGPALGQRRAVPHPALRPARRSTSPRSPSWSGAAIWSRTIHVYAGRAAAVPAGADASLAGRWGARLPRRRRAGSTAGTPTTAGGCARGAGTGRCAVGKFNAGQKLNAAFTAGAIPVMLATGLIMRFPNEWPLSWRTGATFVHDWMFLGLAVTITGHILFAVNDPESLRQHGARLDPGELGKPPRAALAARSSMRPRTTRRGSAGRSLGRVDTERARRWAATMEGHAAGAAVRTAHADSSASAGGGVAVAPRGARGARGRAPRGRAATRALGAGDRPRPEEPDAERTCFERDRDRHPAPAAVPAAGRQDAGVHLPRRSSADAPHPRARGRAGRHEHRPVAAGSTSRSRRRSPSATTAATGRPATPARTRSRPTSPAGFDHAVWGADVVLAALNLCRETPTGSATTPGRGRLRRRPRARSCRGPTASPTCATTSRTR